MPYPCKHCFARQAVALPVKFAKMIHNMTVVRKRKEVSWRLANVAILATLLVALAAVVALTSTGDYKSALESSSIETGRPEGTRSPEEMKSGGVPADMIEMMDFNADPCEDAYQVGRRLPCFQPFLLF